MSAQHLQDPDREPVRLAQGIRRGQEGHRRRHRRPLPAAAAAAAFGCPWVRSSGRIAHLEEAAPLGGAGRAGEHRGGELPGRVGSLRSVECGAAVAAPPPLLHRRRWPRRATQKPSSSASSTSNSRDRQPHFKGITAPAQSQLSPGPRGGESGGRRPAPPVGGESLKGASSARRRRLGLYQPRYSSPPPTGPSGPGGPREVGDCSGPRALRPSLRCLPCRVSPPLPPHSQEWCWRG